MSGQINNHDHDSANGDNVAILEHADKQGRGIKISQGRLERNHRSERAAKGAESHCSAQVS